MHTRYCSSSEQSSVSLFIRIARLFVLLLPVSILLLLSVRTYPNSGSILWLGTLFQVMACLIALLTSRGLREPVGPAAIMLYVIALGWLLLETETPKNDWVMHLSQACLLVVPLVFFALQCLRDSGATVMRRARLLASSLALRKDWPTNLMECRLLPEVKALRESLHVDATPALELLANSHPAVRVSALAALEFRPNWRPGQGQAILDIARRAPEPEVRAAAVNALGNCEDRIIIESLAELLRDPSSLVRRTAVEALLWNPERRWHWIRDALRHALADPRCSGDGPLNVTTAQLSKESIGDLHCWATENGIIGQRVAQTLGLYYSQLLAMGSTADTICFLRSCVMNNATPTLLRLEIMRLLVQYRELNSNDLHKLLDHNLPAPLRLVAIEALLSASESPEAIAALHDLARLPNREIALATADVVQRRLGIDLGLPQDQPHPPIHSRVAADVARRVMTWATQHDVVDAPPQHRDEGKWQSTSRVNLADPLW